MLVTVSSLLVRECIIYNSFFFTTEVIWGWKIRPHHTVILMNSIDWMSGISQGFKGVDNIYSQGCGFQYNLHNGVRIYQCLLYNMWQFRVLIILHHKYVNSNHLKRAVAQHPITHILFHIYVTIIYVDYRYLSQ